MKKRFCLKKVDGRKEKTNLVKFESLHLNVSSLISGEISF